MFHIGSNGESKVSEGEASGFITKNDIKSGKLKIFNPHTKIFFFCEDLPLKRKNYENIKGFYLG